MLKEILLSPEPLGAELRGFGELEGDRRQFWRWALSRNQSVRLRAAPGGFVFFLLFVPVAGARVTVRINGERAEELRSVRANERLRGSLLLPAGGTYQIDFDYDGAPAPGSGADARDLSYVVEEFVILEAETARFERLEVVLGSRHRADRTLGFRIHANPCAQRWAQMLRLLLDKNVRIVKHFAFLGWPGSGRDVAFLCDEMNHHIERVNAFFGPGSALPYRIDMRFHSSAIAGQDTLNRIHKHFEILVGHTWNPSPYFLSADAKARYSICQLNFLCHELEAALAKPGVAMSMTDSRSLAVTYWPVLYRQNLFAPDYEYINDRPPWGSLIAHYAQSGKPPVQAYEHRDEIVARENISPMRFLSGEFDVHLAPNPSDEEFAKWKSGLVRWLEARGLDANDKKVAAGSLIVGEIDRAELGGRREREFTRELENGYDDIKALRLRLSDGRTISRDYPLPWYGKGYNEEMMLAE